ncbi:MAG TPA: hypothetical protein DEP37_06715 [Algoriphagus sp.]|nr:hypothetical protein [Algoriphagus sp.]
MGQSGKAIDPGLGFFVVKPKKLLLVLGEGKQILFGLDAGKEAMVKFKYRRCPKRAFTMMHPPPRTYGGSLYRHPFWQSSNPPPLNEGKETSDRQPLDKSKMDESPGDPYLGITSSRCVSSMVLAGESDQKWSSFIRKQTLKKYPLTKLVGIFVLGRRRKKANIYKHPPPN